MAEYRVQLARRDHSLDEQTACGQTGAGGDEQPTATSPGSDPHTDRMLSALSRKASKAVLPLCRSADGAEEQQQKRQERQQHTSQRNRSHSKAARQPAPQQQQDEALQEPEAKVPSPPHPARRISSSASLAAHEEFMNLARSLMEEYGVNLWSLAPSYVSGLFGKHTVLLRTYCTRALTAVLCVAEASLFLCNVLSASWNTIGDANSPAFSLQGCLRMSLIVVWAAICAATFQPNFVRLCMRTCIHGFGYTLFLVTTNLNVAIALLDPSASLAAAYLLRVCFSAGMVGAFTQVPVLAICFNLLLATGLFAGIFWSTGELEALHVVQLIYMTGLVVLVAFAIQWLICAIVMLSQRKQGAEVQEEAYSKAFLLVKDFLSQSLHDLGTPITTLAYAVEDLAQQCESTAPSTPSAVAAVAATTTTAAAAAAGSRQAKGIAEEVQDRASDRERRRNSDATTNPDPHTKQQHDEDPHSVQSILNNMRYAIEMLEVTRAKAFHFALHGTTALQPHMQTVELKELLERCITIMKCRVAPDVSLRLRFGRLVSETVEIDPSWVQEMVLSLLANAIRYTRKGCIDLEVELTMCTKQDSNKVLLALMSPAAQNETGQARFSHVHGDVGPFRQHSSRGFTKNGNVVLLQFSVKDTGSGVSPEAEPHLFKPYLQCAQTRYGSCGLGLYCVRSKAQALGGSVGYVKNRKLRHRRMSEAFASGGSTFWFSTVYLPMGEGLTTEGDSCAEPAQTPTPKGAQPNNDYRFSALTTPPRLTLGQPESPARSVATPRLATPVWGKTVILITEDAETIRLATQVAEENAEANSSGDCSCAIRLRVVRRGLHRALAELAQNPCDMVLLDADFPEMDCLQAVRSIRSIEQRLQHGLVRTQSGLCDDANALLAERHASDESHRYFIHGARQQTTTPAHGGVQVPPPSTLPHVIMTHTELSPVASASSEQLSAATCGHEDGDADAAPTPKGQSSQNTAQCMVFDPRTGRAVPDDSGTSLTPAQKHAALQAMTSARRFSDLPDRTSTLQRQSTDPRVQIIAGQLPNMQPQQVPPNRASPNRASTLRDQRRWSEVSGAADRRGLPPMQPIIEARRASVDPRTVAQQTGNQNAQHRHTHCWPSDARRGSRCSSGFGRGVHAAPNTKTPAVMDIQRVGSACQAQAVSNLQLQTSASLTGQSQSLTLDDMITVSPSPSSTSSFSSTGHCSDQDDSGRRTKDGTSTDMKSTWTSDDEPEDSTSAAVLPDRPVASRRARSAQAGNFPRQRGRLSPVEGGDFSVAAHSSKPLQLVVLAHRASFPSPAANLVLRNGVDRVVWGALDAKTMHSVLCVHHSDTTSSSDTDDVEQQRSSNRTGLSEQQSHVPQWVLRSTKAVTPKPMTATSGGSNRCSIAPDNGGKSTVFLCTEAEDGPTKSAQNTVVVDHPCSSASLYMGVSANRPSSPNSPQPLPHGRGEFQHDTPATTQTARFRPVHSLGDASASTSLQNKQGGPESAPADPYHDGLKLSIGKRQDSATVGKAGETIPPWGKRVLVLEDERTIGKVMMRHIRSAGYEADWAENGVEGLKRLQERRYLLVLCDLFMPEMTGWEVCEKWRAWEAEHAELSDHTNGPPKTASSAEEESLRNLYRLRANASPVFDEANKMLARHAENNVDLRYNFLTKRQVICAVTAHILPEDQRRAIDAGADRCYKKPFPIAKLKALLSDCTNALAYISRLDSACC